MTGLGGVGLLAVMFPGFFRRFGRVRIGIALAVSGSCRGGGVGLNLLAVLFDGRRCVLRSFRRLGLRLGTLSKHRRSRE